MSKYRIVAARPKKAINHVNSQFKLYKWDEKKQSWIFVGWKSIGAVSALMEAGHEMRTGKITDKNTLSSGAAVELELRIATNKTNYKISDMPVE